MKKRKINRKRLVLYIVALAAFIIVFSFQHWISIFYPQPHHEEIMKWSDEYGVDPNLVFAIVRAESKFEPRAVSSKGALGLMQIMPDTGLWIAGQLGNKNFQTEILFEPEINIRYGCWYLADLCREFKGNLPLVIAAYNAGRGRVQTWQNEGVWSGELAEAENIPYYETRNYLNIVWNNYKAYQNIYD